MFFYDPKLKAKLPYYDRFPLVYVIKSLRNEFWGANLHYLPIKKRLQATRKLMQGRVDLPKACFHKYLQPHVEGLLIDLAEDEWDTAILLPTEDFVKYTHGVMFPIDKQIVWDEVNDTYYDKLKGVRIVKSY